jgi:hypothetical protein
VHLMPRLRSPTKSLSMLLASCPTVAQPIPARSGQLSMRSLSQMDLEIRRRCSRYHVDSWWRSRKAMAQSTGKTPYYLATATRTPDELYASVRSHSLSYKTFASMTAWTYATVPSTVAATLWPIMLTRFWGERGRTRNSILSSAILGATQNPLV